MRHLCVALCLVACSSEPDGSRDIPPDDWYDADAGVVWGGHDGAWSGSSDGGWSGSSDGAPAYTDGGGGGGTNISLGGAGDFGYFRRLLDAAQVPHPSDFDAQGFFSEHFLSLPPPTCGDRVCLQALLGVMADVLDDTPLSMLQLGLNTAITIDPTNRPPLTLAVVVDVSGSMSDEGKIDYVRAGLHTLIDALADTDEISIVTYSDEATLALSMGPVAGRRAALHAIADGLVASGGTNLEAGLRLGYQTVAARYDVERQDRVILLSDGQPTAGIIDEAQIMTMSAGFNATGIALTTIGLGLSFNAPLMRGLAERGYGNFYFLESSAAIDEVFRQELAYLLVPVAFDVTLSVVAGSQYRFERAHGTSFWETTEDGGSVSVPSVFVAHRTSDGDVTPDGGGRRGGGSALLLELAPREPLPDPDSATAEVATIDVTFREPGQTTPVTRRLVVSYPYAADYLVASGHFSADEPDAGALAQKAFLVLDLYLAIERACTWFHEGRGTEAIALLERARAAALDYDDSANGGAGDVDVGYDIDLVAQLIDVMVSNGAVRPDPLELPADPWPAD